MTLIHPMSLGPTRPIEPERQPPAGPMAGQATGQASGQASDDSMAALRIVLSRCALALTRREHDADDLVQDTLARLLERTPELTDLDEPEGYAVATLTRLWLTKQRRLGVQARRLRTIAADRIGRAGLVSDSGELDRIEQLVATFPPRQRAVLVLRAVMGLAIPEIAEALDLPTQTVRSNLHLARQRVRAAGATGDPR